MNSTAGRGGAIWVGTLANLSVVDSQFISNSAILGGGALFVTQGSTATLSTQNVLSGTSFVGNIVTGTPSQSNGGGIFSAGDLSLNNVTFKSNRAGWDGGAIYDVSRRLGVRNSSFANNRSDSRGGAIFADGADVLVSGDVFSANISDYAGGAIFVGPTGSLDVSASVFDLNSAYAEGGAITAQVQSTTRGSTFTRNHSEFVGGAFSSSYTGALTLENSTFAGNTARQYAGAVSIFNGHAALTNLTVSANSADGYGGGIYVANSFVGINNVTLTGNTADSDNNGFGEGGGIYIFTGTVNVMNSIIAGNFDTPNNVGPGTIQPDCSGTLTSGGHNLLRVQDGCTGFTDGVNGDKVGSVLTGAINPMLAPLGTNGGATLTHALLPGSPALNAGSPLTPGSGGLACAASDQRGVRRPLGPFCDMGAYEAGGLLWLPLIRR